MACNKTEKKIRCQEELQYTTDPFFTQNHLSRNYIISSKTSKAKNTIKSLLMHKKHMKSIKFVEDKFNRRTTFQHYLIVL